MVLDSIFEVIETGAVGLIGGFGAYLSILFGPRAKKLIDIHVIPRVKAFIQKIRERVDHHMRPDWLKANYTRKGRYWWDWKGKTQK